MFLGPALSFPWSEVSSTFSIAASFALEPLLWANGKAWPNPIIWHVKCSEMMHLKYCPQNKQLTDNMLLFPSTNIFTKYSSWKQSIIPLVWQNVHLISFQLRLANVWRSALACLGVLVRCWLKNDARFLFFYIAGLLKRMMVQKRPLWVTLARDMFDITDIWLKLVRNCFKTNILMSWMAFCDIKSLKLNRKQQQVAWANRYNLFFSWKENVLPA